MRRVAGVLLLLCWVAGCGDSGRKAPTIRVRLRDAAIDLQPAEVRTGTVVFRIANRGSAVHNLALRRPGYNRATGEPMRPTRLRVFTTALRPGAYTLYCPIADHSQKGETVTLQVTR